MSIELASPGLAAIAYRIATEPNFIEKLRNLVEIRKLDNGETLSEADAAVLRNFIDSGIPDSQSATNLGEGPDDYDTWIG